MEENQKKEMTKTADGGFARALPFILYAAALFIALCFFLSGTGVIGRAISNLMFGLFSWGAWSVPVLIVLHGIFYRSDAEKHRLLTRVIVSAIALVTLSSLAYTISYFHSEPAFSIADFYRNGKESIGGGAIGGTVGFALVKLIGPIGLIILAALILVLYIAFFLANDSGVLHRFGYWTLNLILNVADWIAVAAKKCCHLVTDRKKNKQQRLDREKRNELENDEFFAVDNGMKTLKIEELGILESRDDRSAEASPVLRETVHPKNEVFGDESDFGENEAEDKRKIFVSPDVFFDEEAERDVSDEKAEEKAQSTDFRSQSNEESADQFFAKEFDPYDLATSEKLANKPSSRAAEQNRMGANEWTESISDLTPEDVERARRKADFEMRKRVLLERAERQAKLQREAAEQAAAESEKAQEQPAKADAEPSEAKSTDFEVPQEYTEPVSHTAEEPADADSESEEAATEEYTSAELPRRTAESVQNEFRRLSAYQRAAEFSGNIGREIPKAENDPQSVSAGKNPYAFIPNYPGILDSYERKYQEEPAKEEAPRYPAEKTGEGFSVSRPERAAEPAERKDAESYRPTFRMTEEVTIEDKAVKEDEDFNELETEEAEDLIVHRAALKENVFTTNGEEDPEDDLLDGEGDLDEEDEDDTFTFGDKPEEDEVEEEEIPEDKWNPEVLKQQEGFAFFAREREEEKQEDAADAEETDFSENPDAAEEEEEENPPFEVDEEEAEPVKEEAPVVKKPDYSNYVFPSIDLLAPGKDIDQEQLEIETHQNADSLIETLASFGVAASIKGVDRGPRITRFEVVPAAGVRVSAVTSLFNDISLNIAIEGIRMEAPIPGRSAIGFEIPNKTPVNVSLRDLIASDEFSCAKSKTFVCVGKDVCGAPVFGDIASMPHMLVAGATGMGKSVCINSLLISMLYKARPDELKLILIDPKAVEFKMYNGIPHLLIPVVTDPKQAAGALMWAIDEMERRYALIEQASVRNIAAYNAKVAEDPSSGEHLPLIVIVIDELNDLMLQVRDPVEMLITRITQKARAAGIHMIIGTQRPDVKCITGNIKSNIPTRIACKVISNVDSRTILDVGGAEKLLNRGDMLFLVPGKSKPVRVQGAFVSDNEVESIMDFLKGQVQDNSYDEQAIADINRAALKCSKHASSAEDEDDGEDRSENSVGVLNDQRFLEAVELAINSHKISTALLQRRLHIGYGKAAGYLDSMLDLGIVSEPDGQKPRDVLITMDEWHEKLARVSLDD